MNFPKLSELLSTKTDEERPLRETIREHRKEQWQNIRRVVAGLGITALAYCAVTSLNFHEEIQPNEPNDDISELAQLLKESSITPYVGGDDPEQDTLPSQVYEHLLRLQLDLGVPDAELGRLIHGDATWKALQNHTGSTEELSELPFECFDADTTLCIVPNELEGEATAEDADAPNAILCVLNNGMVETKMRGDVADGVTDEYSSTVAHAGTEVRSDASGESVFYPVEDANGNTLGFYPDAANMDFTDREALFSLRKSRDAKWLADYAQAAEFLGQDVAVVTAKK